MDQGHAALANVRLWQRRNDEAIEEIDRAMAIGPNDARFLWLRAMIRTWSGYLENAISDAKEANRLDPKSAAITLWTLGMVQYHAGRYDEAGTNLRHSALLNPDFMPVHLWLAANDGHLCESEGAKSAIDALHRLNPAMSIQRIGETVPFKDTKMLALMADDLRKAGLPE
jgi:tetratricopeptide (TPR) repeat protein